MTYSIVARDAGTGELDVAWAEILDAAHEGEVGRARERLTPLLVEEPRWALYARAIAERGRLPHMDELLA